MLSRIMRWIIKRWPREAVLRWLLEEEMPGATSSGHIFGSSVRLLFLLPITTDLFQLICLIPTVDQGFDRLNDFKIERKEWGE